MRWLSDLYGGALFVLFFPLILLFVLLVYMYLQRAMRKDGSLAWMMYP